MALNRRQQQFIDEYLQCWNATEAAKRAGYSKRTAHSIGHENLNKPEIREELDRRLAASHMSAAEALMRLAAQARANVGSVMDKKGNINVKALKKAAAAGLVKSYSVTDTGTRVVFYDAQAAMDKILRVSGAYVDRHEITGPGGGVLPVTVVVAALQKALSGDVAGLLAEAADGEWEDVEETADAETAAAR